MQRVIITAICHIRTASGRIVSTTLAQHCNVRSRVIVITADEFFDASTTVVQREGPPQQNAQPVAIALLRVELRRSFR